MGFPARSGEDSPEHSGKTGDEQPAEVPAYRLPGEPTDAEVARVAAALGVPADDLTFDSGYLHFSSEGEAATGDALPADLPGQAEARRIALEVLGKVRVPVVGAEVQVENPPSAWRVSVVPRLAGLPAPGVTSEVGVGGHGAIVWANTPVGGFEQLDSYRIIGQVAAAERQRAGTRSYSWSIDPWPGPTVVGEAASPGAKVTKVELVLDELLPRDGAGPGYLVPFYWFTAGDGSVSKVAAAADPERPPG